MKIYLLSFRRRAILYNQKAIKMFPYLVLSVRLVWLVWLICCLPLLSAARDVAPARERSGGRDEQVKGVPQPRRWAEFVKSAGEGKVLQVPDEVYPRPRLRAAAASEMFNGKFRPEAKTSYS